MVEPFGDEREFNDAARQDTAFTDTILAAAVRENRSFNVTVGVEKERHHNFPPQRGFNAFRHIQQNPEKYGKDIEDLAFGDEQDRFMSITSEAELDYFVPFMKAELQRVQTAERGGIFPYMIGGIGTLAVDPLAWLEGGPLGKAYTAWRVATRAGKAAKGALLAGTAAGVHEGVLQTTQDLRTWEESIMAIGLSTATGGLLGGVFGRTTIPGETRPGRKMPSTEDEVANDFLSPDGFDDALVTAGDPESVAAGIRDSVGAARAESRHLPGERAGLFLDNLPGGFLSNPMGRSIHRSYDFMKRWVRAGRQGEHVQAAERAYSLHSEILEKLMDTRITTTGTAAGIAKGRNVETVTKHLQGFQVKRTGDMQQAWADMRVEVFQNEGLLNDNFNPKISRLQFENEVRTYRLMQDEVVSKGRAYEPSEELPLTQDQHEAFTKWVKKGAEIDKAYYDHFSNLMVETGMLTREQVRENYMPQAYLRDAILADPATFKRKLAHLFMREADEEWMRAEGYLGEGQTFEGLRRSDPELAEEAYAEWQASTIQYRQAAAEAELIEAERLLANVRAGERIARKTVKRADAVLTRRKIAEARERAATRGRELAERRARRDRLETEYQAIVEAAHAARTRTLARQEALLPTSSRDARPGQRVRRPGTPERTTAEATAETRAREAARRLRSMDAQVRQLEREVDSLNTRLEKADRALREAEELRAKSRAIARDVELARRKASSRVRKAKAEVARATTAEKRTLQQQIDGVYEALTDHKKTPFGILPDSVVGTSGRVKDRTLNWGELILDPELQPFLVREPERMSLLFSEDISPRIGLRKVFGNEDLGAEMRALMDSFTDAEKAAKAGGDNVLAAKIARDRLAAQRDLIAMRDRILGRFRLPDNPNSAVLWGGARLRELMFVRLLGKVLLSSQTDLATGSLATQSGFRFIPKMAKNYGKLLKKIPDHEVQALLIGYENSNYYNRTLRTWGLDDAANVERGIGTGLKRKITGRTQAVSERLVHTMNQLNGMIWWNQRNRVMFGTVVMDNMRRHFADFANQPKVVKDMYLRRQIDADMAKRILHHFQTGGDEVDGVIFPNLERLMKDDPAAYTALTETITSMLDEALIVPGHGDLPLMMSGPMGKLIFQFQSFSFAAVNKYIRPLVQQGDSYAAVNAVLGMGLATLGYAARMATLGPDGVDKLIEQAENRPQELVYEAFTRSPLIGPAAPWLDMTTRMVAGPGNARLAKHGLPKIFPNVSRHQEKSAWMIPFGPSIGAAETLWEAGSGLIGLGVDPDKDEADAERVARKWIRLMPFQNWGVLTGVMNNLDVPGFRPVPKE